MNNKRICIISCTNNVIKANLELQISKLHIPAGFSLDFLVVNGAKSMCAGYNEAAAVSDAKFKIYIRDDIEICNEYLLEDLLAIFNESAEIGIVGALGVQSMPVDMIIENGILFGPAGENTILVEEKYKDVMAVTGDFIATQVDIRWDEANIDDWYTFALSQCAAFRCMGYRIVAAGQEKGPWIKLGDSKRYDYQDAVTEKCRKYALEHYSSVFQIKYGAKRFGIMDFKEIKGFDFIWPLASQKADFKVIDLGISIYSSDNNDYMRLVSMIREQHLDVLISFNFSPLVSNACESCGIMYISWVYDCPQQALYDDSVGNKCNYIFSFDKKLVETTKTNGAENVFHQPLAFNSSNMHVAEITDEDEKRFSCQVSFVGNLYEDDVYQSVKESLSEKALVDYENVFRNAYGKWDGVDRISNALAVETINEMAAIDSKEVVSNLKMDIGSYYEGRILARDLANKERIEMVKRLGKYGLKFYTGSSTKIDGIIPCPKLDYSSELPKAYFLSKINIGTTLHSITSGIPLRVFDIMGCGGFLLTNYQLEISELFIIGKEIEIYRDFDEMEDKIKYYLANEDIRIRIAYNGYKAVNSRYNFEKQFLNMLSRVGLV